MDKLRKLLKKMEEFQEKLTDRHIDRILFPVVPVFIFVISQTMLGSEGIKAVEKGLLIFNILIFEALAYILLGIIRRMRAALLTVMIPVAVFSLANSYVRMFRGSFIMPWDFIALRTAANVAGNYDYSMDINARNGIIAFVILAIAVILVFSNRKLEMSVVKRALCIVVSSAYIVILGLALSNEGIAGALKIHDSMFAVTKSYTSNGMMVGFLYKLQRVFVEKPEGYSKARAKELLDSVEVTGDIKPPEELPDVIVVMNEAFSDLKVDGGFTTNKDYMPFVHSLPGTENTVTGYAHVSVLGGLTPNSEFEFLTGNTMTFLPENSVPFQMYVRRKMDALPWYMTELGYFSLAMHPYHSSGWDRTIAWPFLGFQETRFLTDFNQIAPDAKKIRDYISDEAMYEVLIKKLESRDDPDQPMFAFNVTMQNHSSYSKIHDNFPPEIFVDGADDLNDENQRSLTNYLSLVCESDRAFEKLIEHYKNADRDTIILMFGDHQPDPEVAEPIYTMNGKDVNELSEEDVINDHMVPFIIWANFDIEEKKDVDISLNYLGNLLLKEAGIPLTRYRTYTERISGDYPFISAIGGERADKSIADQKTLRSELNDLACMQYYEMFEDDDEYK